MKGSEKKAEKKGSNESVKQYNRFFSKLKVLFNNYLEKTSIEVETEDKSSETPSSKSTNHHKPHETKEEPKTSEESPNNHHALPGSDKIFELERNFIDSFKSEKLTWVNIVTLIIGVLLIILGIIILSGSSEKVADNVVFGERAVLAVFMILIGVIVMAIAVAYKLLNKTFLNKLFKDLKVVEKKSEDIDKSNSKVSKKK